MKRILLLFIAFFSLTNLKSQDISFYHRNINDEFTMPKTEWGMSAGEFQLLSRNVRLMDWFYGAVVPGYVHFRARDNAVGYTMLGTRLAGYAGFAYVLMSSESSLGDILVGNYGNVDNAQTYKYITGTSLVLVLGSYLFDMIHGNYRMRKKQELIRYKYSTKLMFSAREAGLSAKYKPRESFLFGLCMNF